MSLETLVRRIATQVRWRRAEPYAVRGLFYGARAGAPLLAPPPIPLPSGRLLDLSPSSESEETRDRPEAGTLEQEKRPLPRTAVKTPSFEERDYMQRGMTGAGATAGDLSAVFKDTSLANQRPDFNSFLKKGDERLKMLEQVDRLPDLQSDFTASQYKMVFKKSKALTGGLRPDQISPQ